MLKSYEKPNRISTITKILSIIPIIILVLGFWSYAYVEGYYIHVEGSRSISIPVDKSFILVLDSTNPTEFKTIVKDRIFGEGLLVQYKGKLHEGFSAYNDGDFFTVEGPLPFGSEIHIEWSLQHKMFRAVNVATNEIFGVFGVYPKDTIESLDVPLLLVSAVTLFGEIIYYGYNKKHNQPTVINYYKTQILIIKKEILFLLKH